MREALRARVPDSELESVVGLLGSKLDISVRGALGAAWKTTPADEDGRLHRGGDDVRRCEVARNR